MTSPYGPSGGNDPNQQWGQQPYGGQQGTPSGGFPSQGGYGQPQQPQYGGYPQQPQQPQQQGYPQQQQPQQPPQGYQPTQQQPNPYAQPQQPQQQYGGYPGQVPQTPQKKSNAWVWIVVVVVVLAVAAVGILGFVTPGFFNKKVLDQAKLQDGVKGVVEQKFAKPGAVGEVKCPADQEAKEGHEFDCDIKVDGQNKKVHVRVTNENGDYQVSQPK
ncbi:uncharacterized protein DUF4333 [Herbihabitans rhizosphaerae]|uniref:Uncharacterized protein DUF4333 n=1 Tax=Herbihabitans rhizosphaerae TaxID=1872711 RepID=A0A4Q7L2J1_9PSEU|nr:DUF4333 domain-containing protein [Herbihabitans rhizosphaerae]RZS43768.1 uncharacterized protein DUF4333 [Herbihabitans rhizosphaerae]